ncbi:ParA family protein [Aliivibrio salmonicida]|uniref:ParA family protein n=2 Tax=Aliivibrio salmonicida TaxID=40269 RepID=UPI0030B37C35
MNMQDEMKRTQDALLVEIADRSSRFNSLEMNRRDQAIANDKKHDIESIIYNHCVSEAVLRGLYGVKNKESFKAKVRPAIEQGIISEPTKIPNNWLYQRDEACTLLDYLGVPKWSDKVTKTQVVNVQNQKGGTGKSTTAVSIAAAMALNLTDRMRIALIDLDPQGSLRNFLAPNLNNKNVDILTSVDLMLGNKEVGSLYNQYYRQGITHKELVMASLQETHITNLKIIPAYPEDERFNDYASSTKSENGEIPALRLFKEKIIDVIRDDFDLILIDTGPHNNPLVWSSMYAANGLLIPVTPRKLDVHSSEAFYTNLSKYIEFLPEDAEPFTWYRVLAVNRDTERGKDDEMIDQLSDDFGDRLLIDHIERSTAFELASRNYRTVLDMKPGDYNCPAVQYKKATESVNRVARALRMVLRTESLKYE